MAHQLIHESLAEQITQQIRDQIHTGELAHGQALESTRELGIKWGVSGKTIIAALEPLVAEGLVISRNRVGRFVNAPGMAGDLAGRIRELEAEVAALRARVRQLESNG